MNIWLGIQVGRLKSAVSHIARKTSEIWGTLGRDWDRVQASS